MVKLLFSMSTGYLSMTQLTTRLNSISTEAALLAGFAFTGLTAVLASETELNAKERTSVVVIFSVCASLSMALNTVSVVVINFISQVLLGSEIHPDDYKNLLILASKLRPEFLVSFITHLLGLVFFLISSVLVVWLKLGWAAAVGAGVVVGISTFIIAGFTTKTYFWNRQFIAKDPNEGFENRRKNKNAGDISGWLGKKGENRKGWNLRYFVLKKQERVLHYFEDAAQNKYKGSIDLNGVSPDGVRESIDNTAKGFPFEIVTRQKVFVFSATTQGELDLWLGELQKVIKPAKK